MEISKYIKFPTSTQPWPYNLCVRRKRPLRRCGVSYHWNGNRLDGIRKLFMNPSFGHSWHVQIITLRVSFSLNTNGKKDRQFEPSKWKKKMNSYNTKNETNINENEKATEEKLNGIENWKWNRWKFVCDGYISNGCKSLLLLKFFFFGRFGSTTAPKSIVLVPINLFLKLRHGFRWDYTANSVLCMTLTSKFSQLKFALFSWLHKTDCEHSSEMVFFCFCGAIICMCSKLPLW